jgi:iron(III) transport system substrate-binding protein
MKDAPHPNAARLFIEFMLGKEYSEFLRQATRWPVRSDVAPPKGLPALNDIKIITVPTEQMMKELQDVQRQFRDIFGI